MWNNENNYGSTVLKGFFFFFFFLPFHDCKNCEFIMYCFSLVRLLVLILIRAILKQAINNKMVSKKSKLQCLLLRILYTCTKFIVICKPRTLNDGR